MRISVDGRSGGCRGFKSLMPIVVAADRPLDRKLRKRLEFEQTVRMLYRYSESGRAHQENSANSFRLDMT